MSLTFLTTLYTILTILLCLSAIGATRELAKEESETQGLAKATEAQAFEEILDKHSANYQTRMGVEDIANTKVYQGSSEELKDTEYAKHKASFDKQHNTINYKVSVKGFNEVENVAGTLVHESTHKAISESGFAKKYINGTQEKRI